MPSAAQEEPEVEDDEAVIARIRVLLKAAKARDKQKGFPGCTLGDRKAFDALKHQSDRCAVTANKLTCAVSKLNSFRYVNTYFAIDDVLPCVNTPPTALTPSTHLALTTLGTSSLLACA
jgi:hypothetical protein